MIFKDDTLNRLRICESANLRRNFHRDYIQVRDRRRPSVKMTIGMVVAFVPKTICVKSSENFANIRGISRIETSVSVALKPVVGVCTTAVDFLYEDYQLCKQKVMFLPRVSGSPGSHCCFVNVFYIYFPVRPCGGPRGLIETSLIQIGLRFLKLSRSTYT